jgi:UDP-N-acetylmuramoyl-tripeptide--D-alanyl-D-alanine ligase
MSGSMTLKQLAAAVKGQQVGSAADLSFSSVSTDSRNIQEGELFIALQGPHFDGNKFVKMVAAKGAVAALVSCQQSSAIEQVVVADTHKALADLAAAWRKGFRGPMVAITGSNGKTTVKEMVTAIFSKCGAVLATEGNLNNDIGVPLTLLKLRPEHQYAVIEMGANHIGEIDYSAKIASSEIAVITNAGAAHLAGFGDLNGVARTKGEIVSALPPKGTAILNRDDAFYEEWKRLAAEREVISFGFSDAATVHTDIESASFRVCDGQFDSHFSIQWNDQSVDISLKLAGHHNLKNSLAAAAACLAAGCSLEQIKQGLESMKPVKGRLCPHQGIKGSTIIDDSYNANPASCSAALALLSELNDEKWMALGTFAELGELSAELHHQMGKEIKEKGIVKLFAVGEETKQTVEAFGEGGLWFAEQGMLIKSIKEKLGKGVTVLIKGSRSQKMERVVEALTEKNSLEGEVKNAALAS